MTSGILRSSWYLRCKAPAEGKPKGTARGHEQREGGKHRCFSMMVVFIMDAWGVAVSGVQWAVLLASQVAN
jgi:hypothetical protein